MEELYMESWNRIVVVLVAAEWKAVTSATMSPMGMRDLKKGGPPPPVLALVEAFISDSFRTTSFLFTLPVDCMNRGASLPDLPSPARRNASLASSCEVQGQRH